MPKFDELPMPAQAEIRKARGEAVEDHPQKNRLSLLQRLANVGLGRRDEETEPPIAARASGPAMPALPPIPTAMPTPAQRCRRRRYRNTHRVLPRRDWTSMVGRRLLPRRPGRRSPRYPRLPATAVDVSVLQLAIKRPPLGSSGGLYFCTADRRAMRNQLFLLH